VIGPSHHVYSERLNLSGASVLETPLGNLNVDHDVRRDLMATGLFDVMSSEVDADEHSLEMQVKSRLRLFSLSLYPFCLVPLHRPHDEREIDLHCSSNYDWCLHLLFSAYPQLRAPQSRHCRSICSNSPPIFFGS
jgi:hypothetical protein